MYTLIALVILILSWCTTTVAFGLPYWRSDSHNHGGFFQICGTSNITFLPSPDDASGSLVPDTAYSYRCVSLDAWVDNLEAMFERFDDENPTKTRLQFEAQVARSDIKAGLFLEVFRLFCSMFFGLGAFYCVCWPLPNSKKADVRGMVCLLGIYLTPFLILVNIIVSLKYWEYIGVGYFDQSSQGYFGICAQIMVATGFVDLLVQYSYFRWGTRRNGWSSRGTSSLIAIGI
ncbi:hypothetical protein HK101_004981 [Irineochytrium annulatum]|nr:hypothetical protein HK101_004981 [Irineochytrium annulatum]